VLKPLRIEFQSRNKHIEVDDHSDSSEEEKYNPMEFKVHGKTVTYCKTSLNCINNK
jgi:hypothetical protein